MQLKDLKPNPKNPRQISDRRLEMLQASLAKFGDLSGFVDNVRSGTVISGHQKQKVVPPDAEIVIERRFETPTQARTVAEGYVLINGERFKYRQVDADEVWETEAMLAANKQGGEWDNAKLSELIAATPGMNLTLAGFQISEVESINIPSPDASALGSGDGNVDTENNSTNEVAPRPTLSDRFLIAPFSTFNAREGWWQDRKRQWIAIGIKSELGRGGGNPQLGTCNATAASSEQRAASSEQRGKG